MLRRLSLRDFAIVRALEVDFDSGFSVLTGETGAGKSILVDALQLALGSRGDSGVVREGTARSEITAEFDTPPHLCGWLAQAGFDAAADDEGLLVMRRTIDSQGKSRAWINGSSATLAQLREAADQLVDIHGQHAWQSLTRPAAVRALLDAFAGVDAAPLAAAWSRWKAAAEALRAAEAKQGDAERERERLAWQIGEVDKLGPAPGEWEELDAEHQKLSNAQALLDAAGAALQAVSEAEINADGLTARAVDALQSVIGFDSQLAGVADVLESAQAQLQDAAHTLSTYLHHTELEPDRLQAIDERLAAWMSLARRYRRPPADLAALLAEWKAELSAIDAASDREALQRDVHRAEAAYTELALSVSTQRRKASPALAVAITDALQQLGMAGGRFEIDLPTQESPQSHGLESVEFLVAGHHGSTPRPLARVASGGELSRIALAIAVTTRKPQRRASTAPGTGTLIFDEIDAGIGGTVAETVGRLMKQLAGSGQVLAVTHLPQVAAFADHHFVVSKSTRAGHTLSDVQAVEAAARVAEIARMLGGERSTETSLAHAAEMLATAGEPALVGVAVEQGKRA